MNELNLPLRRSMPPEVRERLRERVRAEPPPPARFARVRGPLAAAVAAALLAAGAVAVTRFETEPAVPLSSPARLTLNRCWGAIESAGQADRFPGRATWRPVTSDSDENRVVTGYLADEKPVFCVITGTTVTVSDPNAEPAYAESTLTGALLTMPDGGIAGVADPSWGRVGLAGNVELAVAPTNRGLFTLANSYVPDHTLVRDVRDDPRGPAVPLPPAPPPAVSIMDRSGSRDRQAGATLLAACLGQAQDPAPHLWLPGAYLDGTGHDMVLARNGDRVAKCVRSDGDVYEFYDVPVANVARPVGLTAPLPVVSYVSSTGEVDEWGMVGTVPVGTARLQLTDADGRILTTEVIHGTFVAKLGIAREGHERYPPQTPVHAVVYGRNGPTYDGPFIET